MKTNSFFLLLFFLLTSIVSVKAQNATSTLDPTNSSNWLIKGGNTTLDYQKAKIFVLGNTNSQFGTGVKSSISAGSIELVPGQYFSNDYMDTIHSNGYVGVKLMNGKGSFKVFNSSGDTKFSVMNGQVRVNTILYVDGLLKTNQLETQSLNSSFTIKTRSIDRFIITKDGNIGVGITSPTEKFEVNGNIKASGLNITGSISASGLNITGNVGIGTNAISQHKLAVAGSIIAEEVNVKLQSNWPDYVFDKSYKLQPLNEVEVYINENGHLPGIPSSNEIIDNGIDLAKMNALLLEKIEELTLHVIEQNKQIEMLKETINAK